MRPALLLLIAATLAACSNRWESAEPIELQFRLARERAQEGLTPIPLDGTRVNLYLHDEVLLSNEHLESARTGKQDGKPVVELTFNRAGSRKLEDVTLENKGQRLAVVLDSILVSAPRIDDVITNGRTVITGDFSEADVKAIAKRLQP